MENIHPGAQPATEISSETLKVFKRKMRIRGVTLKMLNKHLGIRKKNWLEYLIDQRYGQENAIRATRSIAGCQLDIEDFTG